MKHIVLTGGFGNLGSFTVRKLIKIAVDTGQAYSLKVFDLDTLFNRQNAQKLKSEGLEFEAVWGDILDTQALEQAFQGADLIVHMAAIIPPVSTEKPELARSVNVDGTASVLKAMQQACPAARLVFASSVAVYGQTLDLEPPVTADTRIKPSDPYGEHKAQCEAMIRDSGIEFAILRIGAAPPVKMENFDPIVFQLSLDTRVEFVHPEDVGQAFAAASWSDQVWGKTLLIGGGPDNQMTYQEFLGQVFEATGIGALPNSAFGSEPFYTDWMDTRESQDLLQYQAHSYDRWLREMSELLGWKKSFIKMLRPLIRYFILKQSPHYKKA